MKLSVVVTAVVLQLFLLTDLAKGHGKLTSPIGRGSRWRIDSTVEEKNYDDVGNYCGGFVVQYNTHGGKCGLCGDNYGDRTPRDHELGGKYGGKGVIVKKYTQGSQAKFTFLISANHEGYVYFEICNLDKFGKESEECFKENRLKFANGKKRHYIKALGDHETSVILPEELSCKHCVVRWTYYAGNNVNMCKDNSEKKGCGPQETFKNCADIRIKPKK